MVEFLNLVIGLGILVMSTSIFTANVLKSTEKENIRNEIEKLQESIDLLSNNIKKNEENIKNLNANIESNSKMIETLLKVFQSIENK